MARLLKEDRAVRVGQHFGQSVGVFREVGHRPQAVVQIFVGYRCGIRYFFCRFLFVQVASSQQQGCCE